MTPENPPRNGFYPLYKKAPPFPLVVVVVVVFGMKSGQRTEQKEDILLPAPAGGGNEYKWHHFREMKESHWTRRQVTLKLLSSAQL